MNVVLRALEHEAWNSATPIALNSLRVPGRSAKATYRRMERLRERAEIAECEARGLDLYRGW